MIICCYEFYKNKKEGQNVLDVTDKMKRTRIKRKIEENKFDKHKQKIKMMERTVGEGVMDTSCPCPCPFRFYRPTVLVYLSMDKKD